MAASRFFLQGGRNLLQAFLAGTAVFLIAARPLGATHVSSSLDVRARRPPMPLEGYLKFQHAGSIHGEERTGWTDVRHPALDGTVDARRGYDWSDNQVVVLTHNVNAPGGNSTVTGDLRRQDFNVANAALAQAGITVRQENNVAINGKNVVKDANDDAEPSLSELFGGERSRNARTVNAYYVDDIPDAFGQALPPTAAARGGDLQGGNDNDPAPPGGFRALNSGFAVADDTRTSEGSGTSTFAHELGHFLIDNHRFAAAQRVAISGSPTGGHFRLTYRGKTTKDIPHNATKEQVSDALEELETVGVAEASVNGPDGGPWRVTFLGIVPLGQLTADGSRLTGGTNPRATGSVVGVHSSTGDDLMFTFVKHPALTPKDAEAFGVRESGQRVGKIGTRSHLGEPVFDIAGGGAITQIEAMHRSPFIQRDDNGSTYGDRADFDWVEDNGVLESATQRGDNHPGAELMRWAIADRIEASDHIHEGAAGNLRHDHGDWGDLRLDAFKGSSFRTIDVISQTGRYIDMDVGADGLWSARESALDYTVQFSSDEIHWEAGKLINVFQPGWHLKEEITAEDYLGRWQSPVDARFVRIGARVGGDHDGNTQIDAIIASAALVAPVPEPATLALLGAALAGMTLWAYSSRRSWLRPATNARYCVGPPHRMSPNTYSSVLLVSRVLARPRADGSPTGIGPMRPEAKRFPRPDSRSRRMSCETAWDGVWNEDGFITTQGSSTMKVRCNSCRGFLGAFGLLGGLFLAQPGAVRADHIARDHDIPVTRLPLAPDEGYLHYQHVERGMFGAGEERTGWTDIRHPVNNNGTDFVAFLDRRLGYDRSDFFVQVHNKVARIDPNGMVDDGIPTPDMPRDYDVANQIWAQAGISVLNAGVQHVDHRTGNAAGNTPVNSPITLASPDEVGAIQAQNRQAAPIVNNWYATQGTPARLSGNAQVPVASPTTHGTMIFDAARGDTFAHELGHYLLDSNRFLQSQLVTITGNPTGGNFRLRFGSGGPTTANIPFNASAAQVQSALERILGAGKVTVTGLGTSASPWVLNMDMSVAPLQTVVSLSGGLTGGTSPRVAVDTGHSPSATDLMAAGGFRAIPAGAPKGDGNGAPRQPGQRVGNIGTVSHLNRPVVNARDITQQDGTVIPAGTRSMSQTEAVHRSPFVQHRDNGETFGERADFDWVEHNLALESAGAQAGPNAADNHRAADAMIWEIDPVLWGGPPFPANIPHQDHDHGTWGELVLPGFGGPFIRTIDVISQVARYTDMDVDPTTLQWSHRASALDYVTPEFSVDGILWHLGTLVNVFIPGWTEASAAEDYVARWSSPVEAQFMRFPVSPFLGRVHDNNWQIDAIIASAEVVGRIELLPPPRETPVPEPATLVLLGIGSLGLGGYSLKRRRFRASWRVEGNPLVH